MKQEFVVSSIGFDEQGIELAYMVLPDDVRSEGNLVVSRSISISYGMGESLGAAATDLREAAHALAEKLHAVKGALPVYEPPAQERLALFPGDDDDDDDDDVGMGDGR